MAVYYNEIDPFAASWLRALIKDGLIAPGDVDERSIEDVTPDDLRNYTQCHFFAGIGVWSHALRLAGWPDDRPVWTGSCPCQPFSAAGKGAGFADERHLWPAFHHLISQCRPPVVFGEQVASRDGLEWLDLVQADLEGADYAVGAADLCAAGLGAPHIRQRLYWVADSRNDGRQPSRNRIDLRWVSETRGETQSKRGQCSFSSECCCGLCGMADAPGQRLEEQVVQRGHSVVELPQGVFSERRAVCDPGSTSVPGPVNGFWRDADWLSCRDGKWRPVEPGTFPLAHGATNRVGRLRGYGNAIVPQVAEMFIRAYLG